jgi:hypothetical protein
MAESLADMMLRAAAVDAATCIALDAAPDLPDTPMGFHAQQACEKCLKAVASAAGIRFERTHDLVRLMDILAAHGIQIPTDAQWIDELNPYAVHARYGLVEVGGLDRSRTLATISTLLVWARLQVITAGSA